LDKRPGHARSDFLNSAGHAAVIYCITSCGPRSFTHSSTTRRSPV